MKRIGLISDTHGFLDRAVFKHFEPCNEIWHAGDFGTLSLARELEDFKPLVGVFGNVDGPDIRDRFPENQCWACEDTKVLMTHIGGYPPKYNSQVKRQFLSVLPGLFICGHSHILKIMYDEKHQCLYINPGAAGNQGWHKSRTLVRFTIDGDAIRDCVVIELGSKS